MIRYVKYKVLLTCLKRKGKSKFFVFCVEEETADKQWRNIQDKDAKLSIKNIHFSTWRNIQDKDKQL